jgi:uncharacterized protein (TIGR02246 family)
MTPANPETEAVLAAEDARRTAMMRSDAEALGALFTDDFTYVHYNGFREGRTPYLERMRAGNVRYVDVRRSDETVRFYGETALLECTMTMTFKLPDAEPATFSSLVLQVWVKIGGAWKIAAYASTLIP